MNNSLDFLYGIYFITIIIHIVAGIITAHFVIPLQYKESKVKNGLLNLRKQMLIKGLLSFMIIVVTVIALTLRFFVKDPIILRYIITTMIFLHGVGTLGKSTLDLTIYHQQYTPEQKKLHEKIAKLERKEK